MEIKKVTQEQEEKQETKGLNLNCFPVCNPVHCAPEGKCSPSKP